MLCVWCGLCNHRIPLLTISTTLGQARWAREQRTALLLGTLSRSSQLHDYAKDALFDVNTVQEIFSFLGSPALSTTNATLPSSSSAVVRTSVHQAALHSSRMSLSHRASPQPLVHKAYKSPLLIRYNHWLHSWDSGPPHPQCCWQPLFQMLWCLSYT